MNQPSENLQSLINILYHRAKLWLGGLLRCDALTYLAGISAFFLHDVPWEVPAASIIIVLVVEAISSRVDSLSELAEKLKRWHELSEGFGVHPSKDELADISVAIDGSLPTKYELLLTAGLMFASTAPIGSDHALENLCESAWSSKHLSKFCAGWLTTVCIITGVSALVVLLFLATSAATGGHASTLVAKCISATFSFIVSVGVVKSLLVFFRFSRESGEIESEATRLRNRGNVSEFETMRLLGDYQLLRASSPVIPTWVWRIKRNKLNKLWKQYKNNQKD